MSLHHDLSSLQVGQQFFRLEKSALRGVSQQLFDAVKGNYKLDVVESVTEMAGQHICDCISLANKIVPQMADVLAMQQGKYSYFGEYDKEFLVFEQACHVDMTPVHNLQMECQCGSINHRLKKKPVSHGNILKETKYLHKSNSLSDFCKMGNMGKFWRILQQNGKPASRI